MGDATSIHEHARGSNAARIAAAAGACGSSSPGLVKLLSSLRVAEHTVSLVQPLKLVFVTAFLWVFRDHQRSELGPDLVQARRDVQAQDRIVVLLLGRSSRRSGNGGRRGSNWHPLHGLLLRKAVERPSGKAALHPRHWSAAAIAASTRRYPNARRHINHLVVVILHFGCGRLKAITLPSIDGLTLGAGRLHPLVPLAQHFHLLLR
mmetsp:Transcript_98356/g.249645  ORF Transcript_98356/g.249645 Transcript_98356/m.249645 type:complete len:206 (+) Transcript_98356:25-642(+)